MFGLKGDKHRTCQILHELPGRVRIHCPGLRHLADRTQEIGSQLRALPVVRSVSLSTRSENVLVLYDPAKASTQVVFDAVQSRMKDHELAAFKVERARAIQSTVQERRLQQESIPEILARVLAERRHLDL